MGFLLFWNLQCPELALCAMLCVVSSVFVSNFLYGYSFFDKQLLDRGIDISKGRSQIEMPRHLLWEISQDFTRLSSADDTRAILKKLLVRDNKAYLVDAENKLIGKTTLLEAYRSLKQHSIS